MAAVFNRSAAAKKAAATRATKYPRRSAKDFVKDQFSGPRAAGRLLAKAEIHKERNMELLKNKKRRSVGAVIADNVVTSRALGRAMAKAEPHKQRNYALLKQQSAYKTAKKAAKKAR